MSKNDRDHAMDSFLKERLDTEVPPEVDAGLRQHLAAFRERMGSRESTRERWRRILFVPGWPVAVRYVIPAAVLLLAALMFWPSPSGRNRRLAFADVLEQLREFRPYACTYTWQYKGRRPYGWRLMRDSLTRRREERDDGSILVFDLSQEPNRTLTLFPEQKLAIEETLTGAGPAQDPDILRILGGMRNGNAEDLGMKKIGRRLAQGFHAPDKVNDFTIWADPATGLPIRVELRQDILERTLIMSDFEWDIKLDESLFSTTAPEGYAVQKVVKDGVYPTEEHLIEGLRTIATLRDGDFPSATEFRELQQGFDGYVQRIGFSASEDENQSLRTSVSRALKYIELLKRFYEVSELRYVGDGVELGDAESPVLWWLFRASDTYRVVYGDLSVRDVRPEDLPDFSADEHSELIQSGGEFLPYVCTVTVKDEGRPDRTHRLMRWSLSRRREIQRDGTVTVVDLSHSPVRMLELIPDEKRAVETILIGRGPAQDPDTLEMAKDAQGGSGENLGLRVVEGREAQGYRTVSPGSDITFWIDEETELPLSVEIVHTGTGRQITMSEFQWDVELDESLFSTTAPGGYAVQRIEQEG
jgi:outer membrane lipoprotein-sorting protein